MKYSEQNSEVVCAQTAHLQAIEANNFYIPMHSTVVCQKMNEESCHGIHVKFMPIQPHPMARISYKITPRLIMVSV